jgi:hypothetical protein
MNPDEQLSGTRILQSALRAIGAGDLERSDAEKVLQELKGRELEAILLFMIVALSDQGDNAQERASMPLDLVTACPGGAQGR